MNTNEENKTNMNIYEKLQIVRVGLQNSDLKKSGYNEYSNFHYFELGDFLPKANELFLNNRMIGIVSYLDDHAELKIINIDNLEDFLVFTCPNAEISLRAAHSIQNIGAVQTYQRRYLYMTALEITESDLLDATHGKNIQNNKVTSQNKTAPRNISNKTGQVINDTIRAYSQLTNKNNKEIIQEVERIIHKNLKAINEKEAESVLGYLYQRIDDLSNKQEEETELNIIEEAGEEEQSEV